MSRIGWLACAAVMLAALPGGAAGQTGADQATEQNPGVRFQIGSLSDECIDSAFSGDTPEMMLVICEDVLAQLDVLEEEIDGRAPASAMMNDLLQAQAITLDAIGEAHGLMIDNVLSETRCAFTEQGFVKMAQIEPELSAPADADFHGILYRGFEDKARMCRRHWAAPDGAIPIDQD